jgi:hypothetical protein
MLQSMRKQGCSKNFPTYIFLFVLLLNKKPMGNPILYLPGNNAAVEKVMIIGSDKKVMLRGCRNVSDSV